MTTTRQARRNEARHWAGVRSVRFARSTGTLVAVLATGPAELDDCTPWATLCDDHGEAINHDTRTLAETFASCPEEWCSQCQVQVHGPLVGPDGQVIR